MKDATVYVIDDEQDVRDALRMLIKSVGLPVETFESALEFLDDYELDQPGCIVADIRMPGMSGLDLQQKLNAMGALIPVIIISGHADVPTAVRAIQDGAVDLLEKPFSDQLLLDKIQNAIRKDHESRVSHAEQSHLLRLYDSLTPREREIMAAVLVGKMNKVIAYELQITTRTVEMHRSHIMEKMGAKCLADLLRFAQELDLLHGDP